MKKHLARLALIYLVCVIPCCSTAVRQIAYLKAFNSDPLDYFGAAVAIGQDRIVIGAPFEASNARQINGNASNNLAADAGAAYVYVRSGGKWLFEAYLKASNSEAGDRFGTSVSISGNTIVVGAPGEAGAPDLGAEDNSQPGCGAAYVFMRRNGNWVQVARLKAPNGEEMDEFGTSVAVAGDRILVGAPGEDSAAADSSQPGDNTAPNSGAAYLFFQDGSAWNYAEYWKPQYPKDGARFGASVATNGLLAVVGAPGDDSPASGINQDGSGDGAAGAGAAYAYGQVGETWVMEAYLKASNSTAGAEFGAAVSCDSVQVVVGSPGERSDGTNLNSHQHNHVLNDAGSAYIFRRGNPVIWTMEAYLKPSNTREGMRFGSAVGIASYYCVVGAPGENSASQGLQNDIADFSAPNAGAAYQYISNGSDWSLDNYVKATNNRAGHLFGAAVGIDRSDLVIGAPGESSAARKINGNEADTSAPDAGAAFIFDMVVVTDLTGAAKQGKEAPELANTRYHRFDSAMVNADGKVLFGASLRGAEAGRGRSRGVFDTLTDFETNLSLQAGDPLDLLGAEYIGTKVKGLQPIAFSQDNRGVIRASLTTGGEALLKIEAAGVSPLIRTGVEVPAFGTDTVRRFREVAQSATADALAVAYQLRAPRNRDSGILFLDHNGAILNATAREGETAFTEPGVFGQFRPQVAMESQDSCFFIAPYLLDGERKYRTSLFIAHADGTAQSRYGTQVGEAAPGPGVTQGEVFRSFISVGERGSVAVLRATLKGGPKSQNEGIWNCNNILWLRKGAEFDPINHPGLHVRRIIKFWPVGNGQLVVQAVLGGANDAGVTKRNNQALLLRQDNDTWRILIRTGDANTSGAVPRRIVSADVDRFTGSYAVVAVTTNGSAVNLGLWKGTTLDGTNHLDDDSRKPERALEKGSYYRTADTNGVKVRSFSLRPPPAPGGAAARGQGQVVRGTGRVVLTLNGGKVREELVVSDL